MVGSSQPEAMAEPPIRRSGSSTVQGLFSAIPVRLCSALIGPDGVVKRARRHAEARGGAKHESARLVDADRGLARSPERGGGEAPDHAIRLDLREPNEHR